MGPYVYAAQYQQPSPEVGGIVKLEWFYRFDLAHPPAFDRIVQSWNTANKPTELSDYSVCTTWGVKGRNAYLMHVSRNRVDYPSLKAAVISLAQQHQANEVLVEDCASGIQICPELGGKVYGLRAVKPHGNNKVMRMHAQAVIAEEPQGAMHDAAIIVVDLERVGRVSISAAASPALVGATLKALR